MIRPHYALIVTLRPKNLRIFAKRLTNWFGIWQRFRCLTNSFPTCWSQWAICLLWLIKTSKFYFLTSASTTFVMTSTVKRTVFWSSLCKSLLLHRAMNLHTFRYQPAKSGLFIGLKHHWPMLMVIFVVISMLVATKLNNALLKVTLKCSLTLWMKQPCRSSFRTLSASANQ